MWYVHPKPEKEQPDTVSLALVESKNAAVEIQKTKEKLSKKAGNNTISSSTANKVSETEQIKSGESDVKKLVKKKNELRFHRVPVMIEPMEQGKMLT